MFKFSKTIVISKPLAFACLMVATVAGFFAVAFKADFEGMFVQKVVQEKADNKKGGDPNKSTERAWNQNFPLPLPLPAEPPNTNLQQTEPPTLRSNPKKSGAQQYFELTVLARGGNSKAAIAAFKLLDHCHRATELLRAAKSQDAVVGIEDEKTAQTALREGQCSDFTPAMIDSRITVLSIAVDLGDVAVASTALRAGPGFELDTYLNDPDPLLPSLRRDPRYADWAAKVLPLLEKAAFAGDKDALSDLAQIYYPQGSGALHQKNPFKYAVIELVNATLHENSAQLMDSPLILSALNNLTFEQQTAARQAAEKIVLACCIKNKSRAKYQ